MKNNQLNLVFVIAAVFAATMLALSVVVEALFDDADARRKKPCPTTKHGNSCHIPQGAEVPEPVLIPISLPNPSILNQLV